MVAVTVATAVLVAAVMGVVVALMMPVMMTVIARAQLRRPRSGFALLPKSRAEVVELAAAPGLFRCGICLCKRIAPFFAGQRHLYIICVTHNEAD